MKNAYSNRWIPISPLCKKVFDLIVEENNRRGVESEYLFVATKSGERMHAASVDKALSIANREAGLNQRSVHKIRKTVLSKLDMSGNFTLERIRELAGHSRQSIVLYTNYFYHIDGLEGIKECKTFEEVVDYEIPDLDALFADDDDVPKTAEPSDDKPSEKKVIPFKWVI